MDSCIIFDLDGTLADLSHRLPLVRKTPPDWPAFFAGCPDDLPNHWLIDMLDTLHLHNDIFICSGRPEEWRPATLDWLAKHEVPFNSLLMRPSGDHRPDTEVKKEMLQGIRGQGYEPLCAIDDRPSVVKMWRENGVPCLAMDDAEWHVPGHHLFGDKDGK